MSELDIDFNKEFFPCKSCFKAKNGIKCSCHKLSVFTEAEKKINAATICLLSEVIKSNKEQNKAVLSFIKLLRKAAPRKIIEIYTQGGCYQFYLILKAVFTDAQPYKVSNRNLTLEARGDYTFPVRHVVTKIGNKYYDIKGIFTLNRDMIFERISPMDEADIKEAEKFKYPSGW